MISMENVSLCWRFTIISTFECKNKILKRCFERLFSLELENIKNNPIENALKREEPT